MRIDRPLAYGYFIWLACAAIALFIYVSRISGLQDFTGDVVGRDFVNMWTGGQALVRGELGRLFDYQRFHDFQTELFGSEISWHNWSYPPPLLLFVAPLGFLPYPAALIVWSAVGLVLYVAVGARRNAAPLEYALLALAPASIINLVTGQNGFFTAALLWIGLRLLDRQPVAAGIAFGLLTLKPQLGILLPLVLLLDRRWSVILSAIVTTLVLFGVTFLLLGPNVFAGYLHEAVPYQNWVLTEMTGFFIRMMPTAFMNARLMGLDAPAAWLVQIPFSLFGVVFVVWAWWRTRDFDLRTAALLTGTFLASPYVFIYDMTAFGPALIALWVRTEGVWGRIMLGMVWLMPVLCAGLGLLYLPLSALLLAAFAVWLIRHIADGGLTR